MIKGLHYYNREPDEYLHTCPDTVRRGFPPRPVSGEGTLSIRNTGVSHSTFVLILISHHTMYAICRIQIQNNDVIQVFVPAQATLPGKCSSATQARAKAITKGSTARKVTNLAQDGHAARMSRGKHKEIRTMG